MRMTKGLKVDEDSLSFDVINDVCMGGKGHYLGSEQTLSVMQSEYIYPILGDRTSPNVWAEQGKPVLLDKAVQKKNELLSSYYPKHINDEADLAIRAEFDIHLTREQIGR